MRADKRLGVFILGVSVMYLACSTVTAQISGLGDNKRLRIDPDAQQRAKKWLKQRQAELKASGYTPPSYEERMITLLKVVKRRNERRALQAMQKSEFQAARAQVYMELAREFASVRVKYNISVLRYQQHNNGEITVQRNTYEGEYAPEAAQQRAAYYGNLAAKNSGIARAQRFRAKTLYPFRILNTEQRIKELEALAAAKP